MEIPPAKNGNKYNDAKKETGVKNTDGKKTPYAELKMRENGATNSPRLKGVFHIRRNVRDVLWNQGSRGQYQISRVS
jgi:hypothetical protein